MLEISTLARWTQIEVFAASIVEDAVNLCARAGMAPPDHVSYCALFTENDAIYSKIQTMASDIGRAANVTQTGTVFVIPEIQTIAGALRILKVRKPDSSRPERGDADFALKDYEGFKRSIVGRPDFSVIVRDEFEMIELVERGADVRAYFSSPPVEEHGEIPNALLKFGYR